MYTACDIFNHFALLTEYPVNHESIKSCCHALGEGGFDLRDMENALNTMSFESICEHYTESFDFKDEVAPYVAYHAFSKEHERAGFMSYLAEQYKMLGTPWQGGELPDHIPQVLRFLSSCNNGYDKHVLMALKVASLKIRDEASKTGSFYGCVYNSLTEFADKCLK